MLSLRRQEAISVTQNTSGEPAPIDLIRAVPVYFRHLTHWGYIPKNHGCEVCNPVWGAIIH